MSAHVPAWKRLGLQLKHGNEQNIDQDPIAKRRKLTDRSSLSVKSNNEQVTAGVTEHVVSNEAKPVNLQSGSDSCDPGVTHTAEQLQEIAPAKGIKRKKSVTFAADSKSFDGLGESDVQTSHQDSFVLQPSETKQRKKKKRKEPDQGNGTQSDSTYAVSNSQSKPYLEYLDRFAADRSHWKFNKNRQVQLLQNLFNLYRIPASYDGALLDYISNLQGEVARQRVRDDAQKIISEDETGPQDASDVQPNGNDGTSPVKPNGTTPTAGDVRSARLARAKTMVEVLSQRSSEVMGIVNNDKLDGNSPLKGSERDTIQQPQVSTSNGTLKRNKRSRGAARKKEVEVAGLEDSDDDGGSSGSSSVSSSSESSESNDSDDDT